MCKKILLLTICTFFLNNSLTLRAASAKNVTKNSAKNSFKNSAKNSFKNSFKNYYKNKAKSLYTCKAINSKKENFEVFFQSGNYHTLNLGDNKLNPSSTKNTKVYIYKDRKLYFVYKNVIEIGDAAGNNTYLVFMASLFGSLKVLDIHIDHEVPEDTVGELLVPNILGQTLKLKDKLQIYSGFCI